MDMDDDEGVTFDLTPQWPTTGRTEMILDNAGTKANIVVTIRGWVYFRMTGPVYAIIIADDAGDTWQ